MEGEDDLRNPDAPQPNACMPALVTEQKTNKEEMEGVDYVRTFESFCIGEDPSNRFILPIWWKELEKKNNR